MSGSLHASVLVVLMPYLSSLLQFLARLVAGAGGGASADSRGGVGGLDGICLISSDRIAIMFKRSRS